MHRTCFRVLHCRQTEKRCVVVVRSFFGKRKSHNFEVCFTLDMNFADSRKKSLVFFLGCVVQLEKTSNTFSFQATRCFSHSVALNDFSQVIFNKSPKCHIGGIEFLWNLASCFFVFPKSVVRLLVTFLC